jgi:hypothetical protein
MVWSQSLYVEETKLIMWGAKAYMVRRKSLYGEEPKLNGVELKLIR